MVKKFSSGVYKGKEISKKTFLAWLHYGRDNFLGPNGRIFQLNILESIGPYSFKIIVQSKNTFFILYSHSGQLCLGSWYRFSILLIVGSIRDWTCSLIEWVHLQKYALTFFFAGIKMVNCATGDIHLEFSIYR